jgi:hypothetical protein
VNWYGYVYKTVNLLNGKIYIGRRKGPFDRSYHGSGIHLLRAVKLHGPQNFLTEVLSWAADLNQLCALEVQHIRAFRQNLPTDMLYNIADGGIGGNTGHRASEETRRLMSDAHRGAKNHMYGVRMTGRMSPMFGRKHSDEAKKKMGESHRKIFGSAHGNFGKVRSAETREKISLSKKGKTHVGVPHSEETKKILREKRIAGNYTGSRNSFFGRHHSDETKRKISESKRAALCR